MEDRGTEATFERVFDPFGCETARAEPLELGGQRIPLLVVVGEAEAPGPSQRVARQLLEPVERPLGLLPQPDGGVTADGLDRHVEGRRAAAQCEAPVPSTRPAGDLASVVEPDLEPGFREPKRGRATGDPSADHHRIGSPVEAPFRYRRRRLVQPVAGPGQFSNEVALRIGTKARLPTSLVPLTVLKA